MTVVAADGQYVHPVTVDEFRIATAETYDVIVEPSGKAHVTGTRYRYYPGRGQPPLTLRFGQDQSANSSTGTGVQGTGISWRPRSSSNQGSGHRGTEIADPLMNRRRTRSPDLKRPVQLTGGAVPFIRYV